MPAKMDTEVNLRFLFICFKHSNFSTIDYHGVAAHFEIKAPAARMRLMRLKQALELDMNMYPHSDAATKKRVRKNPWAKSKGGCKGGFEDEADDDEAMDDVPLMERWQKIKRERGLVKNEDGTVWVKQELGRIPVKEENEDRWAKKETVGARVKKEKANGGRFKVEEDGDVDKVHFKAAPEDDRAQMSGLFSIPANNETAVSRVTSNNETWDWRSPTSDPVPTSNLSSLYTTETKSPATYFSPRTPATQDAQFGTLVDYTTPYRHGSIHMSDASPYIPRIVKPENIDNAGFNQQSVHMTGTSLSAPIMPIKGRTEDVQMMGASSSYTPHVEPERIPDFSVREGTAGTGGDASALTTFTPRLKTEGPATPDPAETDSAVFFSPPELRLG